jgi:exodeoxyribonuclease-3
MKIFSWNVNGIRAVIKKDAFAPFIKHYQPDILCLQETKAQPGEAIIDLPDYEEYWNSAIKKGYSGTAVFSKPKPLNVSHNLPDHCLFNNYMANDLYGNPNTEGRLITAEYEEFYLVTVYTPNAKGDLSRVLLRHQQWDPAFLAHCRDLEKIKPVIFCGDLNVAHTEMDLANPGPNKGHNGFTNEERAGFQAFIDAGFVDVFRLFSQGKGYYTWWSYLNKSRDRNVGWRIDYFLVSQALQDKVVAAEIHPEVMGSDHCPISLTLDI